MSQQSLPPSGYGRKAQCECGPPSYPGSPSTVPSHDLPTLSGHKLQSSGRRWREGRGRGRKEGGEKVERGEEKREGRGRGEGGERGGEKVERGEEKREGRGREEGGERGEEEGRGEGRGEGWWTMEPSGQNHTYSILHHTDMNLWLRARSTVVAVLFRGQLLHNQLVPLVQGQLHGKRQPGGAGSLLVPPELPVLF